MLPGTPPSATHLLAQNRDSETTPSDKIDRFRDRFGGQKDHAEVHKAQCKQLLINDWENNVSVTRKGIGHELGDVWRDRLEVPAVEG